MSSTPFVMVMCSTKKLFIDLSTDPVRFFKKNLIPIYRVVLASCVSIKCVLQTIIKAKNNYFYFTYDGVNKNTFFMAKMQHFLVKK